VPRSNRPRRRGRPTGRSQAEPLDAGRSLAGMQRHEDHADGGWIVRQVSGASSGRAYRCPGCQQEVPAGTPHVVAWPADAVVGEGLEQRRHWHTPCWRSRDRRRPR
jgi:hypothetical protein